MRLMAVMVLGVSMTLSALESGCRAPRVDDLNKLGTVRLTVKEHAFELWIADDDAEQMQGLMNVTADRMTPLPDGTQRGMIFIFDHERELNFWMKNTIIPLDIAYLDSRGTVVATHTMAPLDERPGQYPSGSPAQYAIEVNAGVWGDIGLRAGDAVVLPSTLLKSPP